MYQKCCVSCYWWVSRKLLSRQGTLGMSPEPFPAPCPIHFNQNQIQCMASWFVVCHFDRHASLPRCQLWAFWKKFAWLWGGKSTASGRVTTVARAEFVCGQDWLVCLRVVAMDFFGTPSWHLQFDWHKGLLSFINQRDYLLLRDIGQKLRSGWNRLWEKRGDTTWIVCLHNVVYGHCEPSKIGRECQYKNDDRFLVRFLLMHSSGNAFARDRQHDQSSFLVSVSLRSRRQCLLQQYAVTPSGPRNCAVIELCGGVWLLWSSIPTCGARNVSWNSRPEFRNVLVKRCFEFLREGLTHSIYNAHYRHALVPAPLPWQMSWRVYLWVFWSDKIARIRVVFKFVFTERIECFVLSVN